MVTRREPHRRRERRRRRASVRTTQRTAGAASIDEPGALFEYWWPPDGETSAVAPQRATPRSIAKRVVVDDRLDEVDARQLVRAVDLREVRKHVEVRDGDRDQPAVAGDGGRDAARGSTNVIPPKRARDRPERPERTAAIPDPAPAPPSTAGRAVRYRSRRDGMRADVGRAIAMATGGALRSRRSSTR